jgi:type III restriction enzyme
MASGTIDQLIINTPYEEPAEHWSYERESRSFTRKPGRRPAGYITATPGAKAFDDPGIFRELPLVNQIRPRVKAWREAGYPGPVSGVTRKLLEHWRDPEQREGRRFFFCQLEAVETLIWLTEAPAAERVGIEVPGDGGDFLRICTKMATGSGKTIVMSMIIAWHILNKMAYPQDKRFSKYVFVVAPGLTVKSRLGVLAPTSPGNYYDQFNIVPPGFTDQMKQAARNVMVRNWHGLMPLDPDSGPKVVKKGPESDEAFTRRVLEDLANAQNLLVINDEAHHAWRIPPKTSGKDFTKQELEEATQWIGGLDRIHKTRGILTCYDLTATPFAPTGKKSKEETLFGWIVSDFGLNDAIESGLVKTPRVVVRDDGTLTKEYKSRLYHIYMDDEVRDDLNRKAEAHEPLPDLVQNAYYLLGKDWLETAKRWAGVGMKTPPVMITVANRIETSSRIKYAFDRRKIRIDELCVPERTLQIDSKVLDKAEALEEAPEIGGVDETEAEEENGNDVPTLKVSKKDQTELLRLTVNTVGQMGKPGEQVQNVISVGMLSEGWDAKTVTHIMGLRAFTSQLLCEQVVGRGLRRTSYDVNPVNGLFEAEYVNIFGVPFTFLPHEGGEGAPPPPAPPKTEVKPLSEKVEFEITWPSVIRIDHLFKPKLTLDTTAVKSLLLDAAETRTLAELAPIVDGKPEVRMLSEINLQELAQKFRMQRIIFETARDVFDQMKPTWKGNRDVLLAQVIRVVEKFIASGRLDITPPLFNQDPLRRRLIMTLNMNHIVQHIWEAIRFENTQALDLVFDEPPIRSTGDMRPWYTGRPCELTSRSHINFCVYDSTWEASESFVFDKSTHVAAWVKNDHLGFNILYVFNGVVKKYRPDFLVKLTNGKMLVLEVKGEDSPENRTKREFLAEWVRAVNADGGFKKWAWDVSFHIKDIEGILEKHSAGEQ